MLNYTEIDEVTLLYRDASPSLLVDCEDKGFTPETLIHTLRVGNLYLNSHDVEVPGVRDSDFLYRFSEICNHRRPASVYDFAFCLALYNSQGGGSEGVTNILGRKINDKAHIEYAKLLNETQGWIFWDYQFENILKLFTYDRRLPALIHKEYRKDRTRVISIPSDWKIDGLPVIKVLESDMFQPGTIYSLILKPAWALFRELKKRE
jgi:hypothetical protein